MQISESLKQSNIPLVEKEILLADLLRKDRSFLHAHPEFNLPTNLQKKFLQRLKRRENYEPLAYILGYQEFYDRKFLVNKNVLIPRTDTEILVQEVLFFTQNRKLTVVDVGTGSGCIGITLKLENPNLKVIATEISEKALKVARKNALFHKVEIEFVKGNLLSEVQENIDVIVANLPYIPKKNWENLPSEIRDWEPRVALESGKSKHKFYKELFYQAEKKLSYRVKIFYEIDGEVFTHH